MGNMLYSFQHKIVKRVISQQCLGCTVCIESIIKEEVEYQDGSTIVQPDHGDMIANALSSNLVTEGDEIALELNMAMSFVVGLIERGTVQHLRDFWGQLRAGIGPV